MKKILMILILLVTSIKAQQPELLWYKLYGGNNEESGRVVREVSDGYVIFGHTRSYGAGYADFYLIKTDKDGVQQWTKTYGGPYDDVCTSGDLASDSGFILVGRTDLDGSGNTKILLIRTDNSGNIIWEKILGSELWNNINCIKKDYDNGYIMIGTQMDFRGSLYSRRIIIKTDVNGEVLWNSVSSFIGKSGSYINPVLNIGYIVTGNVKSYGLYEDRYLDLVDLNGNTIWSKHGNGDGEGLTANVLSDSSYIWSYGNTPYHQPTQYFITKYDKNGYEIFSKPTTRIQAIVESFDNRILLTGGVGGANSVGDISFLKVDSGGNEIWNTRFSGTNYNGEESANDVILTKDSSYVLVGTTTSYQNNWDSKIILLKYNERDNKDYSAILFTPSDNSIISPFNVNFIWSVPDGVTRCDFILAEDSLFMQIIENIISYNDTILVIDSLEYGKNYYWKVRTFNQNGLEYYSIARKFKSTDLLTVLPTEYKLEQNYPNPFNPSTKISWQAPVSGWQTLKVYDVLGNEVATLVNEFRPAGSYEVEFKSTVGSNRLANGVYFYRLQAGNYIETKKMILLK